MSFRSAKSRLKIDNVGGLGGHGGPLGANCATHHHAGFDFAVFVDGDTEIEGRCRVKALGDGGEFAQDHGEDTVHHGHTIVLFCPHRVAAFGVRIQAKTHGAVGVNGLAGRIGQAALVGERNGCLFLGECIAGEEPSEGDSGAAAADTCGCSGTPDIERGAWLFLLGLIAMRRREDR